MRPLYVLIMSLLALPLNAGMTVHPLDVPLPKFVECDEIVFVDHVIFQPQLFGFGKQKTTEHRRTVIALSRGFWGETIVVGEHSVDEFPPAVQIHKIRGRWQLIFTPTYQPMQYYRAKKMRYIETHEHRRPE